jgi:hypothetical protein
MLLWSYKRHTLTVQGHTTGLARYQVSAMPATAG